MARWLTTKTVSRDLKVSDHTVRAWVRQGRVPGAVKLPNGEYRLPPTVYADLLRPPQERASRGSD